MNLVLITALGVGGATLAGTIIGFCFKKVPEKWNDAIMSFAAGVMLCAAVLGLIVPAVELTGKAGLWQAVAGIFTGALFLNLMDKLTPHLHHISGVGREEQHNNRNLNKVLLFVLAIAIHNLPEGLAAGVGFGGGDISNAVTVAVGIALQTYPKVWCSFHPCCCGHQQRTHLFDWQPPQGSRGGGTFIGYFASSLSAAVLPFALAFAGGTMIYIVGDEMIPQTHANGNERMATYSLLAGFVLMLIIDVLI